MTGVKVKVQRHGVWCEVDADEVRPDEWPAVVTTAKRFGHDGWSVAAALAQWIRAPGDRTEPAAGDGQAIPRA